MATWFRWKQWAPAEAMMVVSEMGDRWSPHTPPAQEAARPMDSRVD